MLRFLTHKLKQQSLNEVQPFQHSETEEDRDSGTESDEENAELEALERAMQEREEDQENGIPCRMQLQSPTRCLSPMASVTKRPLQLLNRQAPSFLPAIQHADLSSYPYNGHHFTHHLSSPHDSSDFERCSLDYETTSSTEFDQHSSEEELSVINRQFHPEKRTWSQANRCGSCSNDSTSGSSDEEVKDLFFQPQPVLFSSSPPRGVQKLSKTMSPRLFLASVASGHLSVSPRKRHRHMTTGDCPAVIQRPCLDFEKMQKTLLRKHVSHGISKARIVKIKTFNGSSRPPKCVYDPSVFAFRSISTAFNSLPPVEEPSCAY